MSISALFLDLVEAYHFDTCHERVDHLAASFVAELSYTLYLTESKALKLSTVRHEDIRHYEGIFLFLAGYGIKFKVYPLKRDGYYLLAAYITLFTSEDSQARLRLLDVDYRVAA